MGLFLEMANFILVQFLDYKFYSYQLKILSVKLFLRTFMYFVIFDGVSVVSQTNKQLVGFY